MIPSSLFFKKMIPEKTWYKIYNQKVLAIIEIFKTWHHYLKRFKYKVFIFTNHNKFQQFIDTKRLRFCQVC